MKNKNVSAYQEMYMITKGVYQKVLNCVQEKDKIATEQMNTNKPIQENKTISEKIIDNISAKDLGLSIEPPMTNIPTTTKMLSTEPVLENIASQPVVTETETITPPISTETVEIALPTETQQEVYSNPLREQCPQDTEQGSIIPNLFYKPSIKNKRIPKGSNQIITQPQIEIARELRSKSKLPTPIELAGVKKNSFPCSICGKTYTRNHDLKRHLESSTAHKNKNQVLQISNIEEPKPNLQLTQNIDDGLPPTWHAPPKNFDLWNNPNPSTSSENIYITPKIKKTVDKPKLGKPYNKKKSEGGDKSIQNEFNTWSTN